MKLQKKEQLEIFLKENEEVTSNLIEKGFKLRQVNFASSDSEFERIEIYEKIVSTKLKMETSVDSKGVVITIVNKS